MKKNYSKCKFNGYRLKTRKKDPPSHTLRGDVYQFFPGGPFSTDSCLPLKGTANCSACNVSQAAVDVPDLEKELARNWKSWKSWLVVDRIHLTNFAVSLGDASSHVPLQGLYAQPQISSLRASRCRLSCSMFREEQLHQT